MLNIIVNAEFRNQVSHFKLTDPRFLRLNKNFEDHSEPAISSLYTDWLTRILRKKNKKTRAKSLDSRSDSHTVWLKSLYKNDWQKIPRKSLDGYFMIFLSMGFLIPGISWKGNTPVQKPVFFGDGGGIFTTITVGWWNITSHSENPRRSFYKIQLVRRWRNTIHFKYQRMWYFTANLSYKTIFSPGIIYVPWIGLRENRNRKP